MTINLTLWSPQIWLIKINYLPNNGTSIKGRHRHITWGEIRVGKTWGRSGVGDVSKETQASQEADRDGGLTTGATNLGGEKGSQQARSSSFGEVPSRYQVVFVGRVRNKQLFVFV